MGSLNMRLTPNDHRFFSPDRDLAYCSPHLIHRAVLGLDPDRQEPWIKAFLEQNNISTDELAQAAVVLAEYVNKTLLDPTFKQPFESLTAAGFFALPEPVQTVVLAKIGQVYLSGFFTAIRDVTREPNDPACDVFGIANAASQFQERVKRHKTRPKWLRWLNTHFIRLREYMGI